MESLMVSVRVILPLCLWMIVGYIARRGLGLDDDFIRKMNNVLFKVFLPLLLFRNMLESDLHAVMNVEVLGQIGFALGGVVVVFLALMLLVPRFVEDNARRASIVQGSFRSNTAIFGIPVALSLYGEGNIAIITLFVAAMVPLLNVLCVVTFEVFRGGKLRLGRVLLNIVTNPLILALALGAVLYFLGVQLPQPVEKAVWGFADCATPLSFFLLGAGFTFASAKQNRKALTAVVLLRLLIIPLVGVTAAVLLGIRGVPLAGLLIIFGSPTAVSSYPMACAMGGDGQLSCEIVVFTSAFSILSMFGWIFALNAMGLLGA